MSPNRPFSPFVVAASVLVFLLSTTACIENTCTVNDVTYDFGDRFAALDGCNECVCAEGGAISCTEIACTSEPDPAPGIEPDPAPTDDAGDPDAGDEDAGGVDAGGVDAGDLDAGELDAGELDAGELDAGELDAGELDAGELDDAGNVPLRICETFFWDRYGECICGTNSERGPVHESENSCFTDRCVDDCCVPGDMIDPNDRTSCVTKSAPYFQSFGMFKTSRGQFQYEGYVPGADSCLVHLEFANEPPADFVSSGAPSWSNRELGSASRFVVPINENRILYGGLIEVDCTGEFGEVGQSITIPPASERFSLNIDNDAGVVQFCHDASLFPVWGECFAVMGGTMLDLDIMNFCWDPTSDCRASYGTFDFTQECTQPINLLSTPEDEDFVQWRCIGDIQHRTWLNLVFDYDSGSSALTTIDDLSYLSLED